MTLNCYYSLRSFSALASSMSNSFIKNCRFCARYISALCLAQGEEQVCISPGALSAPEVPSQIPSQLDCLADSKITRTQHSQHQSLVLIKI